MKYSDIINYKQSFVSGNADLSDNNTPDVLDTPGNMYFQIFFHFANGTCAEFYGGENNNIQSGLLGLPQADSDLPLFDNNATGKYISQANFNTYRSALYRQPNAWSYLVTNGEDERALLLEKFIDLLYNISYETPWYFQKISGLDAAIERKMLTEKDFRVDEQRQKITINCLPDAMDNRIGTLLDLYRSIVYSWQLKKEIVPANLRKFDMSIYIFQQQMLTNNTMGYDETYEFDEYKKGSPKFSYKYFEFHNCEFDYNSSKSGYGEINNTEGFNQEYAIDIFFDDMYESRYNQWMTAEIGDMLYSDLISSLYELDGDATKSWREGGQGVLNNNIIELLGKPAAKESIKKTLLNAKEKALKELDRLAREDGVRLVTNLINRLTMGNLFEPTAIQRVASLIKVHGINTADILGTLDPKQRLQHEIATGEFGLSGSDGSINVNNHVNAVNPARILSIIKSVGKDNYLKAVGNVNLKIQEQLGNLTQSNYEYEDTTSLKPLGNLYKQRAIQNNI